MPPSFLQGVWGDINLNVTVDHHSSLVTKDLSKDGIGGVGELFDMNSLNVLIFPESACPTHPLIPTQPACLVIHLELHRERPITPSKGDS